MLPNKLLGYVWFLKSILERKKMLKENYFLMLGFTIKNSKENEIFFLIDKKKNIFKL